MCKRLFLLAFSLLLLFNQTFAAYTVALLPNPKQFGQSQYVSNPDGILSSQTVAEINRQCQMLDKLAEVELCVVAVSAFDRRWVDAYDFSLNLFNSWGVGKVGKNTGVMLFLAVDSRDVQIITGGGVEGLLPDVTCGQILDEHISLLSAGNYDNALMAIVADITNILSTDNARVELLLGWQPKEDLSWIFYYLMFCFMLLIGFAIATYKQLRGKPGQRKNAIQAETSTLKSLLILFCVVAPLPILLFYAYFRYLYDNVQTVPLNCKKCGKTMQLLEGENKQQNLSLLQRAEDKVRSKEYDVWQCDECHDVQILAYSGIRRGLYDTCPACGALTYTIINQQILQHATYVSAGTRRDTRQCACCGLTQSTIVTLPRLVRQVVVATGRGSTRGFGSGNLGGGSFGGGMSFGGGAGRKF